METKIPRGKVIRVPADIKLKGSRHVSYIISESDKLTCITKELMRIFEWMDSEICHRCLSKCESLVATDCIASLLEGDPETIDVFGSAKLIIKFDLNSIRYNYYYVVENLPDDWSPLDIIGCFADADRIRDYCASNQIMPDFGEGMLTFEFNDSSLPIIKVALSEADYIAKNREAIYYSDPFGDAASKINQVLAKLMAAEMNYTHNERVKLVRSVQSIKGLFSFYEKNPELENRLDKALMIKSIGIEDGCEYFYLVESDSRLGVVDIMRHQKDIADISQQTSSGWSTYKCNNCPYSPFSENGSDADVLYYDCINFNPGQLSQMKTDLNNLDSKSPDDLGKSISQLLKVEDNPSAMALLNDLLKDEAAKKKIIDFCTPQKQVEIQLTISRETTKDFYPASIQINRKELTKGTKSRNKYAPYVLWIMSLYDKYLSEKYRESRGKFSIFQFANEDRSEKHTLRGRAYFNDVLALLFGVLYNIFSFDGFSTSRGKRNEDWRREWLQAICGYLKVTNEANNDRILEVIGQIDIENLSEIGPILYRDFNEFIGSPGQQNSYWSGAFLSLTETLVNDIPLIGQGVMPKCEFNATINGGHSKLLDSLEEAFFKLFDYLES